MPPDDPWDQSRQLDVLHAVLSGSLTVDEACRKHGLTPETYREWADRFWQGGKSALFTDRLGSEEEAIEFVLLLGQALHSYGATAYRLEGVLIQVSRRLGLEGRFFSTPTAIMAGFGPVGHERTCLVRVEPGEINLEKLADLNLVTNAVGAGTLSLVQARQRVNAVVAAPPRYGFLLTTFCFGLASMASAVFFGGTVQDIGVSGLVGLVVGIMSQLSTRSTDTARALEPIAAAVATVLAAWAAQHIEPVSPYVVTLAGVVTLLPGFGLTTAMAELATRNLAAGAARLAGAFVQLTGLGFGMAVGTAVAMRLWPEPPSLPMPQVWPLAVLAGAIAVAGLAYTVLLRVRPRDLVLILAAGTVAYGGALLGHFLIGPELGAMVGAFVLALASNAYAGWRSRSATVMIVPGLLLLVPGSIGFQSFFAMLQDDALSGVAAAFRMVLVATSLVAGILFANIAAPPRRHL